MQLHEIRALVWAATIIGVGLIAFWRGGRDERLASYVLLAAWGLSVLLARTDFAQTEWGVLAIDAALFAGLVGIALRSDRYWPLFAAGFHLLAVVTHIADTVDPAVEGWAYFTAEIIWGYLVVMTVGYGAWSAPAHRERLAAGSG